MLNKQIYDSAFTNLAAMDRQGKLPAATKAKAIKLGNEYLVLHNLAVQTLLDNGTPSLASVKAALDAFMLFVGDYITR
jgi:hypothetical protein